jgi:hypothetical protein
VNSETQKTWFSELYVVYERPLGLISGWFGSWWEGEHVCVEKEETEEGVASYRDFHFTFKFNGMDIMDEESMFDKSASPSTYIHEVGKHQRKGHSL